MKLTTEQVQHIAKLARIKLTPQEVEAASTDLSAVLDYIDQLKEVDTNGVEVTRQVTGLHDVYRTDEVAKSEMAKDLLDAAPASDGETVNVKEVL